MLVIADGHRPVAVAGVMGGANSEITDNTHMVVFESATFSGPSVRVTARDLGMRTDASARYEKGLDSRLTMPAVQRACELVEMLDAGDVVDGILDVDNAGYTPFTLPLEPERINALLGLTLSEEEMTALLRRLEIDVTDGRGHRPLLPRGHPLHGGCGGGNRPALRLRTASPRRCCRRDGAGRADRAPAL